MKIIRLKVTNFRGIKAFDAPVPPTGVIVRGANGRGKTSTLKAIGAALAARDIGPDAIHIGADKAEILVDLDAVSVRRVITAKGTSVSVTGRDGSKAAKPTAYLAELLGTSPLDPLDLFLAKPKERRARILEALPITVTADELRAWAPDLPLDTDTRGHGLEVLERVRQALYERRTAANKVEADLRRTVDRLHDEADAVARTVPEDALALADAKAQADEARIALLTLEQRAKASRAADERAAKARAKVVALRAEADTLALEGMPNTEETIKAENAAVDWEAAVTRCEEKLRAARANLEKARAVVAERHAAIDRAIAETNRRNLLREQAAELEAAIQDTGAVDPDAIVLAREAMAAAQEQLAVAESAEKGRAILAAARESEAAHVKAADDAKRLDDAVRALANDAPSALLRRANAIPGLGLEGDDVTLDGKRLDALSGAEQMRFAVEIARRLNAKSKILVVDGLERLDPEQREAFVRHATADDWQLIATLVDRGEPVLAAIEPEAAEQDAAQ